MTTPMRLDRALVERGLARSRAEAQDLIEAGRVRINGVAASKASRSVMGSDLLEVEGSVCPYVSRGGLKLAAGLAAFSINPTGKRCLDAGASTGGFTDCLLQHGARHVTAIDVGHGQMAPSIAADPRVSHHEGINARALSPAHFETPFDLIVADLSFISLTLVVESLASVLAPGGDMVLLVKPQFEVGKSGLAKGGVVRNPALRAASVERVAAAARAAGFTERGRIESPIAGGDGNIEYVVWLNKDVAE